MVSVWEVSSLTWKSHILTPQAGLSFLLGASRTLTYDDYLDTIRLAWPSPVANFMVLHWFQVNISRYRILVERLILAG